MENAVGALGEQLGVPLVTDEVGSAGKPKKSPAQKAIRKTLKGTAHLANLLPTGSVLAFQILSPLLTHEGNCDSAISKQMTLGLIGFCCLACFILCFTDSIRDDRGKVRYVLATLRGFWIIDGSVVTVSKEDALKYKVRFIDFFHGITSIFVFGAVVSFDENVVNCFYPRPSDDTKDFLDRMPIAMGVIGSLLFVAFPTTRHGIGFPLSPN